MLYSLIHPGSGLGNQLFRIVAGKVLSSEYSAIGRENFKGSSFLNIDFGKPNDIKYHIEQPAGKIIVDTKIPLWEEKTNYYNPEINFIKGDTIIDGEFQDERYFENKMTEIAYQWLKVQPLEMPDDLCVIGFRGGEFYVYPELGLPKSYFEEGIEKIKHINPNVRFEVHTDDPKLAREFFPDYPIIHDIGVNWRSMRYAKYAIIANSSFYILPRLIRHHYHPHDRDSQDWRITIAPRYWARRNIGEWSMPQNYYKSFQYI